MKKTKKTRIYTYKKIPDFLVFFGHNFWTDWTRKKVKTVLESSRYNESFDIHIVYWFEIFFRGHWLGRVATRCFRIVQVSHYRKKFLYIYISLEFIPLYHIKKSEKNTIGKVHKNTIEELCHYLLRPRVIAIFFQENIE